MSLAAKPEAPEMKDAFESFMEQNLEKELLRFTTAGSVDDGKSTLIGRLLHDSKSVFEDQLAAVKKSRINRSSGAVDFSLLTDGLRAEREQGITIDVAYRYFETPRRKFIIADTPGHEQYTRNMATGASTANLAVILIDATKGVLAQTRRHTYIASLLGIPNVLVAINKMDLVEYREEVFLRLQKDFDALAKQLAVPHVVAIPISALAGDNVVARSAHTNWYHGPTFLEHLETVPLRVETPSDAVRFPVQYVIRPDQSFRGFAGQMASGVIRPGDAVESLPSGQKSRVRTIATFDGDAPADRVQDAAPNDHTTLLFQARTYQAICRHTALTALAQLRTAAIQAALAGADVLPAAPPAGRTAPAAASEPAASTADLLFYTGTAPLPARGGQPCPPGIPPIGLSASETARIERLARDWKAGILSLARLAFQLRWPAWRRRHQARARWHHYAARMAIHATRPATAGRR